MSVPTTATVGSPVTIELETWGGPSLAYTRADTHVMVAKGTVLIRPYDDFTGPNAPVPSINFPIEHDQTLVFAEAGRVKVEVVGMAGPGPYREVTHTFWLEVAR